MPLRSSFIFGARRLVPVCLAPMLLACVVLASGESTPAALAYFGLLGLGSGLTGVVLSTLWAELYGIAHLGAIRAFAASTMVFSSGLGPAALGMLIDAGVRVESVALGGAAYCVVASALAAMAGRLRTA